MSDQEKNQDGRCPFCSKSVDPLRAGAVSIVGGRIVHFCSSDCREGFLERGKEEAPSAPEAEAEKSIAPEEIEDLQEPSERIPLPPVDAPRPTLGAGLRLALPFVVEFVLISAVAALVVFLPGDFVGGYFLAIIGGAVALGGAATGVFRERRAGPARMIEGLSLPLAAGALVAAGVFAIDQREYSFFAVALLAVDRLGRLMEFAGRSRSGVLSVASGEGPGNLADEWRDNSGAAARVRRVVLILEWARLPLGAVVGLLIWLLFKDLSTGLLAFSTAVVALSPRILRLTTGDAHLFAALQAGGRDVVIRDAHAVQRIASAGVALFMERRALSSGDTSLVAWQTLDGEDEEATLAAVGTLESAFEGSISEAVVRYAKERVRLVGRAEDPKKTPGRGVEGRSETGRILCGSRTFMLENEISTAGGEHWARALEESGRRALFVAVDGSLKAVFGLEQEPLAGVADVTRRLTSSGVLPSMVTSAEVETAVNLGARFGIENVHFEVREEQLESVLGSFKEAGERVLLIGHGPAFENSLRAAEAGVRLGDDGPTMAGVDAKKGSLEIVAEIITWARNAGRSVALNLTGAVAAMMLGIGLSTGWHTPTATLAAGLAVAIAGAYSTFNSPSRLVSAMFSKVSDVFGSVARKVGLKRSKAP